MKNTINTQSLNESLEFNRYGIISIVLLIVGCLGGIVVGQGAVNEIWSLALVVLPTMLTLSLLIAVAPMKYVMSAAVTAVSIDVILLIYLSL